MSNLNKKVLSLFLALIIAVFAFPSFVFAQENNDGETVTAYLTASEDGNIIRANNKSETALMAVPMTVQWFDLSDYGLGEFNRYEKDENEQDVLIKKPTLLHYLIKATEKYYLAGKDFENNTDAFTASSSQYGFYLSSLWGNLGNFMCIVNHDLNTPTADQVELKDNDVIDLSLFTDYSVWNDLSWTVFDQDTYTVSKNDTKSFNISKYSFASEKTASENMTVELYDSNARFVEDLTESAKTGSFEYNFKTKGTYYLVASDGDLTDTSFFVPAVAKITVKRRPSGEPYAESEWSNFRGNENNNAVTTAKLPKTADKTSLIWASELGSGWDAPSQPIIVEDYLITFSAKRLIKLSKKTGKIVQEVEMAESPSYSLEPAVYAEGMIFVALNKGTVQAFDFETLEPLWIYKDEIGGQPNSPITIRNGLLYTGFWKSETDKANFICLDITDEDKTKGDEIKQPDWTYAKNGGFYWAGAYACDEFVVVGTSDGETGFSSQSSKLLVLSADDGSVINSLENLDGDIYSSVSYDKDTDRFYFASKHGTFYSVEINAHGIINKSSVKTISFSGQITSTPAVANGRAYIGVCGESAYKEGSGHKFVIIDLENFKEAYSAETDGYVQSSALITTAYQNEDGYNYVYFTENKEGGSVCFLKDKKGVTSTIDGITKTYGERVAQNCAPTLFTPVENHSNYGTGSLVCDNEGTIYFKNDSNFLMALSSALESIKVTSKQKRIYYQDGDKFDKTGLKVEATFANGTTKDVTDDIEIMNDELTNEDKDVTIVYTYGIYGNRNGVSGCIASNASTYTKVTVSHNQIIINKVTATYFKKGYSGDNFCKYCNKIIKKGKTIAMLKLKKPKFSVKAGNNLIKVKYQKVKDATGFQIKYQLKNKKPKTITVKTKKSLTKIIKDLKKGKYTVKLRAFIQKSSKKAYSKWTNKKTVTVK